MMDLDAESLTGAANDPLSEQINAMSRTTLATMSLPTRRRSRSTAGANRAFVQSDR
jgi:hypothetical protein